MTFLSLKITPEVIRNMCRRHKYRKMNCRKGCIRKDQIYSQ